VLSSNFILFIPARKHTANFARFAFGTADMAIFPFTSYTAHMGTSGLKLNFLIAGIATCAFWLFGYDMSVMV
jgi:hypothetical protein